MPGLAGQGACGVNGHPLLRRSRPATGKGTPCEQQPPGGQQTLSLPGHLFDGGHLGRLGEIFTPDVVYDMSALGVGTLKGARRSGALPCDLARGTPSLIT
jgi:hypothetical protein